MTYLFAFLFCGGVCLLGQIVYTFTKWTCGHIVNSLVVIGALVEGFNGYRFFNEHCGAGASLPISSFGALLARGAIEKGLETHSLLDLFGGVFKYIGGGLGAAILVAFVLGVIFKPKF